MLTVLFTYFFSYTVLASESVKIGYGDAYKPFAWEHQGQATGIQVDFVEEILVKRLGVTVEHISCPWKRCQSMVKAGKLDGFFTVPTDERKTYTDKTEYAFYNTNFVIHTAKNNPNLELIRQVTSLAELVKLSQLTHVHMRGSGWHINKLKPMAIVTQVADASVIPEMLVRNRADLYIEQAELFRYQAKALGLLSSIITLSKPVLKSEGWHLFLSHKSPHTTLLENVDQRLLELKANGQLDVIRDRIFAIYGVESLMSDTIN